MELHHVLDLTQFRYKQVFDMFKLEKSLSFTQSQINLLAGNSLLYHSSTKKFKNYLEYLNIISITEIRGFPKEKSQKYLQQ